jgi:hypothetical protein
METLAKLLTWRDILSTLPTQTPQHKLLLVTEGIAFMSHKQYNSTPLSQRLLPNKRADVTSGVTALLRNTYVRKVSTSTCVVPRMEM